MNLENLFFHFYLLLRQDFKRIISDSAVPGLNRNQALAVDTIIPVTEIIIKFNALIKPLFEKKSILLKQNQTLTQLRDSLLPRLMSGKIRLNQDTQDERINGMKKPGQSFNPENQDTDNRKQ